MVDPMVHSVETAPTPAFEAPEALQSPSWDALASQVLAGQPLQKAQAIEVLQAPHDALLPLLQAAFRVRARFFGRKVKVHLLQNAKSGTCPEDCGFCSQSAHFAREVPEYPIQTVSELVDGAKRAARAGATTYCMVTATRGPSASQLQTVVEAVKQIKQDHPGMSICTSLGMLKPEQAQTLRSAGVDRYNHNLETSERFFPEVATTHSFQDRVDTVRAAKEAGMQACCGGIMGMGETVEDRVELALSLRALQVESIPVNFLNPRPGTPLSKQRMLSPFEALKTLCMFRLTNPQRDIRVAGGRELCLGAMQPMALYPANSMFTQGYLTTEGQGTGQDRRMIEQAGFEPEIVSA